MLLRDKMKQQQKWQTVKKKHKTAIFEIGWKSHKIIFTIVNFASLTQFLCSSIDPGAHLVEVKYC